MEVAGPQEGAGRLGWHAEEGGCGFEGALGSPSSGSDPLPDSLDPHSSKKLRVFLSSLTPALELLETMFEKDKQVRCRLQNSYHPTV